jgi:hypothetical protein
MIAAYVSVDTVPCCMTCKVVSEDVYDRLLLRGEVG